MTAPWLECPVHTRLYHEIAVFVEFDDGFVTRRCPVCTTNLLWGVAAISIVDVRARRRPGTRP